MLPCVSFSLQYIWKSKIYDPIMYLKSAKVRLYVRLMLRELGNLFLSSRGVKFMMKILKFCEKSLTLSIDDFVCVAERKHFKVNLFLFFFQVKKSNFQVSQL